ncbi:MAG: hypothetical protein KKD28_05060 [Chloroflexi bacterium]|nr:hypothetical protein [Chloroflexota bacterium]
MNYNSEVKTMLITRELIKTEIDKIQDSYLEVLFRIVQAFIKPLDTITISPHVATSSQYDVSTRDWRHFVEQMYGCLADDPIERGEQGKYEIREAME